MVIGNWSKWNRFSISMVIAAIVVLWSSQFVGDLCECGHIVAKL